MFLLMRGNIELHPNQAFYPHSHHFVPILCLIDCRGACVVPPLPPACQKIKRLQRDKDDPPQRSTALLQPHSGSCERARVCGGVGGLTSSLSDLKAMSCLHPQLCSVAALRYHVFDFN